MASWPLRLTLLGVYAAGAAVIAAISYVVARRHAMRLAIGVFAACVLVPWANFDWLPFFWGWRSLLGNALLLPTITLGAAFVGRRPRIAALGVGILAAGVNGLGLAHLPRHVGESVPIAPAPIGPNVVLLLLDTLRADHLGVYGYQRPTSPAIDRVAAEAMVFERAMAQAPWTKPSVVTLLTGTYVHRHGVVSKRDALGPEPTTLAERFQARGYRTAAFSSNPFVSPLFGFERGFDTFFESARASGVQGTILFRAASRLEELGRQRGVSIDLTQALLWPTEANPGNADRDQLLTERFVEWLRSTTEQPFFAYVHLMGPHAPYDPPAAYARAFANPRWDGRPALTQPPRRMHSIFDAAAPLGDLERDVLIGQYDAAIASADTLVGMMVEELRRANLLDQTLLVLTADHGEEFYEHRNWLHGHTLYDEMLHVPLIMRWPGRIAPGRRSDLVGLVDVYTTVVGLTEGENLDRDRDGRNLFGQEAAPRQSLFSEFYYFERARYVSHMVMSGSLKLIETRDDDRERRRVEGYDVANDPREQSNLLAADAAPDLDRFRELTQTMAALRQQIPPRTLSARIDGGTAEQLRALGY